MLVDFDRESLVKELIETEEFGTDQNADAMSSCSGSDSDPACDTLQDKEYEAIVPQATFTELKSQGLTYIEEEPK